MHKDILTDNWVRPSGKLSRFIGRLDYMHNNRQSINKLLASAPTASLYGRYNPGTSLANKVGVEDPVNRWIRNEAEDIFGVRTGCGIGHNDGVVPARAGQLFGA